MDIINKKVRINCPTYQNGKTFVGVIKSIKAQTNDFTTVLVKIQGHSKSTRFALKWLTFID
jgi:hypothetical protein